MEYRPVQIIRIRDDDPELWFDDWGEGPFSTEQVARYVEEDPRRGQMYFAYTRNRRMSYSEWISEREAETKQP